MDTTVIPGAVFRGEDTPAGVSGAVILKTARWLHTQAHMARIKNVSGIEPGTLLQSQVLKYA
jgi:hypothetical protein